MTTAQGPPKPQGRARRANEAVTPEPDSPSPAQTTPVPPGKWNPTAERLLDAARRLLMRSGFNALSLEKIAREAGVNKPLIYYYFGNKAGLLRALMNSVLEQDVETLRRKYAALPQGEARVHAVVEYSRNAAADQQTNRVFFDTAVHMLGHGRERARLAEWCDTCREQNIWGLSGDDEEEPTEDTKALSAMTLALQDGLALQTLAEPGAVDAQRIWALWEAFLTKTRCETTP